MEVFGPGVARRAHGTLVRVVIPCLGVPVPRLSPPLAASSPGTDQVHICVGGKPIVTLTPGTGRVKVGLAVPVLGRIVDVSMQPGAPCEALREAGHRSVGQWDSIEATAREALAEAARRSDAWEVPEDVSLLAAFGGLAFPLLAAIYDGGAIPLREVPRWAEPVLEASSARDAARVAFGSKATRPVVRSLVTALRPTMGGPVDLTSLALGLIGVEILDPDRLGRVLAQERPSPASTDPPDLPDLTVLAEASRRVCRWGPQRAERVLRDAASNPGGLRLLLDTVRYARDLEGHGPQRLPSRLTDLHDVHRIRIATAPPPRPVVERRRPTRPTRRPAIQRQVASAPAPRLQDRDARVTQQRLAVEAADRADAVSRPGHRIYAPPGSYPPVAAHEPLNLPDAVRRIDGTTTGDLTFIVPRTAGDLDRWSRALSNCLDDYGPAVAAGRSTIIGVQHGGDLRYALEITPGSVVRQFVGPANRPPGDLIRRRVVAGLADVGLLDRTAPGNAAWFAGLAP